MVRTPAKQQSPPGMQAAEGGRMPVLPPQSLEAEQSVLGALLLDNRAWDKVADLLVAEDFYHHAHRLVYAAIAQLAEKQRPFDALTVAEQLKVTGTLVHIGGETFLYELSQNTPSAANVRAYAEIVREKSVLRQLSQIGSEIAEQALHPNGQETRMLLDDAERRVFQIAEQTSRGSGPVQIAALLARATDRIDVLFHSDKAITGVPTGFSDFDNMTSGLQAGDLVIVAGRPSMGKTAFCMNVAEHAAIKGEKPVLVFSMEMPAETLTMRMLSSLGRIDQHKIRTGQLTDEDWPRITSAVSLLADAKLYIDDTPALTPGEVHARARRLAREHNGLDLIILDYLQLMQVPGRKENRATEISEISRSLKTIAKELNVPVIALSQLNRGLEQRQDHRPVMSDLRESGAIEQDADLIVFIYRDEVYHEDSPDKGVAEIIIGKHRNGPIGKVRLTFLGQYTRFENFASVNASTEVFS